MVWTSLVAQTVKHLSIMLETWVRALGWEDPLEREMVTHSSILVRKNPGQGSLAAAVRGVARESYMTQ